MKTKTKLPNSIFSHATIMAILAFVAALGGYGGYVVSQQHGQFPPGFEQDLHVVERVVDGDTIVLEMY